MNHTSFSDGVESHEVGCLYSKTGGPFDYLECVPFNVLTLPGMYLPPFLTRNSVRYLGSGRKPVICCSEGTYLTPLIHYVFLIQIRFAYGYY